MYIFASEKGMRPEQRKQNLVNKKNNNIKNLRIWLQNSTNAIIAVM